MFRLSTFLTIFEITTLNIHIVYINILYSMYFDSFLVTWAKKPEQPEQLDK